MVNTRKKLDDIGPQRPWISSQKLLRSLDCTVRSFATTAGVAVKNESRFEYRLQNVDDSVVYDAVAKGGRTDQTRLGISDGEVVIIAWLPDPGKELALQMQNVI